MARTRWTTDSGGNSRGRLRPMTAGSTETWECFLCDRKQIEFKQSRDRHTRPRCKHCGGIVHPVREFNFVAEEKKALCAKCQKPLRIGNRTGLCNVCFADLDPTVRAHLLFGHGNRSCLNRIIDKASRIVIVAGTGF